ncbi:MAG: DegV family EDD domain-containing protein [Oscillospiraceae bacterium]|jgi:DegV family protein with EDD domain|nr:DegV family EDD domain-containing protein [Oscillospiraceae bacterium]
MKQVILTSDSPADFPQGLNARLKIRTIPLYVNLQGRSLRDGIEVTPAEIFALYDQQNVIPTTSAIPVGDYKFFFAELLEDGKNEIVHFCIGGQLSSSYQNAVTAAKEFEGVYVIDSESMSVGITLELIHAAAQRDAGLDAASLAEDALKYRRLVRITALLGSPTYMKKSGRCSAVSALGANLLNIRPVIGMSEGKLSSLKKLRGKPADVQMQYLAGLLENPDKFDTRAAFLYHTGVTPDEFQAQIKFVESKGIFEKLYTGHAGSITCTHVGDKATIFAYLVQQ